MTSTDKAEIRKAVLARRKRAHAAADGLGAALLSQVLRSYRGQAVAGYMPIHSEIDPRPAMAEAAAYGPVGVPVIEGAAQPLRFALWQPGCAMRAGPFGAEVPETEGAMTPQVVIVPLVAFTADGGRLGYGGGFYDRTLARLRGLGEVLAVGFAYDAQQVDALPLEPTDQRLDMIVTEARVIRMSSGL